MLIGLSTTKYPHFDILHAKIQPMVPKLAPWPRNVLVTKLLGKKCKNTSLYVIDQRYEAEIMLIRLSTSKYPHFDILHAKIQPTVPKLAPWPRKVLVIKMLGKKRKNTSFYVIDQRYEAETMLIGLSTSKYPHFDILHAKIQPTVPKLASWPRKDLVTKWLGKNRKNVPICT